jgi:hypothetical protein
MSENITYYCKQRCKTLHLTAAKTKPEDKASAVAKKTKKPETAAAAAASVEVTAR